MNGKSSFRKTWQRKKGSWFIHLLIFVSYFCALSLGVVISYLCVKKFTWVEQPSLVISWVVVISVFLVVFLLQGLYQEKMASSRKGEILLIAKGVAVGSILLVILVFLSQGRLVFDQREGLLFFVVSSLVLLALFRSILFFHLRRQLLKRGIGVTRVLIIGTDTMAREVSAKLQKLDPYKFKIIGFVDKQGKKPNGYDDLGVIGKLEDMDKIVEEHRIDEIYIVGDSFLPVDLLDLMEKCKDLVDRIYVSTEMLEILGEKISLGKLKGVQLLKVLSIK